MTLDGSHLKPSTSPLSSDVNGGTLLRVFLSLT